MHTLMCAQLTLGIFPNHSPYFVEAGSLFTEIGVTILSRLNAFQESTYLCYDSTEIMDISHHA